MATVNRPPFWVPRPGHDDPWRMDNNWKTSAVIQILSSKKMFGAGGQVVTRKYAPLFTDNELPYWIGPNTNWKNSALIQFLTKQKMFGAGGQVVTRKYAPLYTENDPPPWQWPGTTRNRN